MNWTGGTLQRLKAGRQNGIIQKQKEHFAKVRTQLQNSSISLAPPFRPSYLEDNDLNLGGRLPPFGSGTVRHTGHSRRLHGRRDKKESHILSNIRYGQGPDSQYAAEPRASREQSRNESASLTGNNELKRKRKDADTAHDDELLEAKRMRLLQKPDWVGLAPSRPVNMHFSSSTEKYRIGKRRKIRGPPTGHQKSSESPKRETFQRNKGNYPGPYMSRALPVRRNEDIRIRIGTDALITQTSMQHSDHAQRQTTARSRAPSSDPMSDNMLFDNEHLYTTLEESVQPARGDSPKSSMSVGMSTGFHAVSPHTRLKSERALELSRTHRKHSWTGYTQKERNATERVSNQQTPNEDPVLHIVHHGGGVEHPTRFVFDQRSDTLHVGGATHSPDATNARLVAFEHRRSDQGDNNSHVLDVGSARLPLIADDGSWKFSLAVPDDSSCSSTRERSEAGFAKASQHATLGNQTGMSASSFESASLPSIKPDRESDQGISRDQYQGADRLENPEEPWQRFILERRDNLASDTMHDGSSTEEEKSKSSVKGSPRVLPWSLAVASCVSDGVQEAAYCKPQLTYSRCISSPEAPEMYGLSEADGTAGGPLSAEHSIYSEDESLVHASITNNVSHEMDATLDRNGSGRSYGSGFGPALAKRSERGRQVHEPPIHNIPDGDSDGIDLVDSERLW